jgi:hypothetical protein
MAMKRTIANDPRVPAPDERIGDASTVEVCGAEPWNSTGIIARAGERFYVEVVGSTARCRDGLHGHPDLRDCDEPACARWKDGNRLPPVTAEGWELWYLRPVWFMKRVRAAHWYELCGSFGDDGDQFVVGLHTIVTAPADGAIYLFANDAKDRYGNNYGALRVRLTRLKN